MENNNNSHKRIREESDLFENQNTKLMKIDYLNFIPIEIWSHIFSFINGYKTLELKDLRNIRITCKLFQELLERKLVLVFNITEDYPISIKTIELMQKLPLLERLNIKFPQSIDDTDIFMNLPSNLTSISIYLDREISFYDMEILCKLKNLEELIIKKGTDIELEALKNLPKNIKKLVLSIDPSLKKTSLHKDKEWIQYLPRFITKLQLMPNRYSNLKYLPKTLVELVINEEFCLFEGLETLEKLEKLILISRHTVTREFYRYLPQSLKYLKIDRVTDQNFQFLPPKLKMLNLYKCKLKNDGFKNLQFLEILRIIYCKCITNLNNLPSKLKKLVVITSSIKNDGLRNLPQDLEDLKLTSKLITDLNSLPKKLKKITLSDCPNLNDDGINDNGPSNC